jgi:hypothetical protein
VQILKQKKFVLASLSDVTELLRSGIETNFVPKKRLLLAMKKVEFFLSFVNEYGVHTLRFRWILLWNKFMYQLYQLLYCIILLYQTKYSFSIRPIIYLSVFHHAAWPTSRRPSLSMSILEVETHEYTIENKY